MYVVNQQFDLQIFLVAKKGCKLTIGSCYRIDKPTPCSVVSSNFCCRHPILQLFQFVWEKLLNLIYADFLLRKICLTFPKLMSGNSSIFYEMPEIMLGVI